MMALIAEGAPLNKKALAQLGEWSIWVTMLIGLARGNGVIKPQRAQYLLRTRFDSTTGGGPPAGFRVYASRVDHYIPDDEQVPTPHLVALHDDPGALKDAGGQAIGVGVSAGAIGAAESIGLGQVVVLVLGRTHSSGRDHHARLDDVADSVGLERIHPLPPNLPSLERKAISMRAVSELFTNVPFGSDSTLLPRLLRTGLDSTFAEDPPRGQCSARATK